VTLAELAALKHRRLLMTSEKRIRAVHKVKGVGYPSAQRLAYLRALYGMLEWLEQESGPAFAQLIQEFPSRTDSITSHLSQRLAALREKVETYFTGPRVAWVLSDLAKQIESSTSRAFQEQVGAALGVTGITASSSEQLRALFVHENAKLIRSLPHELVDQVEAAVLRALRQGSTVRQLEREFRDKLALTKRRAQLIARDQVSKYSGKLTRHNQTSAGIEKYRWGTSRDERVRAEHRQLDGQVFSWDKPPMSARNGGRYHPRQGFNCRCDAIPIL
jgi:SPP1 gp7 family putative phage head morphogenesis protein